MSRLPEVNTVIPCRNEHVITLKNNKPAICAEWKASGWVAVDPSERRGLIVLLQNVVPNIEGAQVVKRHKNSVEAVAV